MWRRAALSAIALLLVSKMPSRADIEILNFREALLVKVAKEAMADGLFRHINKAPLNNDNLLSRYDIFIDNFLRELGVQIVAAKSGARVDNLTGNSFFLLKTPVHKGGNARSKVGALFTDREGVKFIGEAGCRLAALACTRFRRH